MKIITKLFLFSTLLAVVLLNTTCNKKLFAKIKWEDYLYDSAGGKPIQGCWIKLTACDAGSESNNCSEYTVGQSVTDASGHFIIENQAATSNRYTAWINSSPVWSPTNKYLVGVSGTILSSSTTICINP